MSSIREIKESCTDFKPYLDFLAFRNKHIEKRVVFLQLGSIMQQISLNIGLTDSAQKVGALLSDIVSSLPQLAGVPPVSSDYRAEKKTLKGSKVEIRNQLISIVINSSSQLKTYLSSKQVKEEMFFSQGVDPAINSVYREECHRLFPYMDTNSSSQLTAAKKRGVNH